MISQSIALSNWTNGVVMITIFGLVCFVLIGFIVNSMTSNDRDKKEPKER